MNIKKFYDNYHKKNDYYTKLITSNNFTYFYILRFLEKVYKKNFSFNRVLDVGCGVGTLALFFSQHSKKVKGVDISARAIDIAKKAQADLKISNVNFYNQELKSYPEKYDLIICTEIIEHIADEKNFLRLISNNLTKNGYVFISTPSTENVLAKSGFFDKFDKEVGHLRRYTLESLTSLLNKNNFTVVDYQKADGILRTILFTTRFGWIIRFIKGPLIPLFHLVDRLTLPIFGECDIQVIAKKK